MSEYPKFEKVDGKQIKIIVEKADIIPVARLLINKESIEKEITKLKEVLDTKEYEKQIKRDIKGMEKILDNINSMLVFAKEQGIKADKDDIKKMKAERLKQQLNNQQRR